MYIYMFVNKSIRLLRLIVFCEYYKWSELKTVNEVYISGDHNIYFWRIHAAPGQTKLQIAPYDNKTLQPRMDIT